MDRTAPRLGDLARLGFSRLDEAATVFSALERGTGVELPVLMRLFERPVADADEAVARLLRLLERDAGGLARALRDDGAGPVRLVAVLGASAGLAEFLVRHPQEVQALSETRMPSGLPSAAELLSDLLESVGDDHGFARLTGAAARRALRVRYRRRLLQIAAWDLTQSSAVAVVEPVSACLADLAAAALEAALAVARTQHAGFTHSGGTPLDSALLDDSHLDSTNLDSSDLDSAAARRRVSDTRLAVIGFGKAGARELNYVSDVDVVFVAEGNEGLSTDVAIATATKLAITAMRLLDETDVEPALWQVDTALRPEGKDGALVRTLDSHVAYYRRWASGWEFQALLKARPLAGDASLGERYVDAVRPLVWQAAAQGDFVHSVQRMRERVIEHIPAAEADRQLKLGPGGLRDIEFTVQLLQLVHGRTDADIRQRATLPALRALAGDGYIGRVEAAEFGEDYRILRLLEHRLQLARLQRTHLMPTDPAQLRALARASGLAADADSLVERWRGVRTRVRGLHERLFYRPLLGETARLSPDDAALTTASALDRLAGVGYRDPRSALAHITALTGGVSRRAAIQRTLLPVLLQWFAEGPDPDMGLLAFRRLSEQLGDSDWYLRMLRDTPTTARRLTTVLSTSRFVTNLLDRYPEAVAWLARDEDLRPRPAALLREETSATVRRHADRDGAAAALRVARRREVLRLALGALAGTISVQQLGEALADTTTMALTGALRSVRRDDGPWPEFAVIAMGRYGGAELGFGSDADVIVVYRPVAGMAPDTAQRQAEYLVAELQRLTTDPRLPLDLDLDLRPEGRNGAVVRSLRSYQAYYERWSLTWESQALLRATGVAGDHDLVRDFMALVDRLRYPRRIDAAQQRELRRIKARVETERLPKGADPLRHLKLGRGSISDVEWLVQLLQLRHAARVPALRTTSTLRALDAAVAARLIGRADAAVLREAWLFASRTRSAVTLWTSRTSDLLPTDRHDLEGVARILEYPPGSATTLEEDYLRITRHARQVFERLYV
ncbi:bifunctional [glutamine synthetase] adenylyltransferase/[glutamine synthetase]-adenylyl-L-tyrosine phosphorylase [uncultured Amnibacterium sp.]|uniref:bifunctional [glutamine synthetase] adenylyltransferase/[glutamine synthetase]-adenylyl-L-tyrosine phosphorylase n=1 Tax=uncultured Amnibacterium sp. TaxID=1631851 RepID=UPI0035CB2A4E